MSDASWFKVYRKDLEELTPIQLLIMIHLTARARYNGNKRNSRLGIDLEPGQFVLGGLELSKLCNCSLRAVQMNLKKLQKSSHIVVTECTTRGTIGFIGDSSRYCITKESPSSRSVRTNIPIPLQEQEEYILGRKSPLSLVPKAAEELEPAKKILEEFNRITGKSLRPVDGNLKWIRARLAESDPPNFDEISKMIQLKNFKWKENPDMKRYIRPETLFNASKFDVYIQETRDALKSVIAENKLFGVAEDAI